jgi:uncharacterized protein (UPF0218 family)
MEGMRSRSEENLEILYRLPEHMRKTLSEPLGPVISTEESEFLIGENVITVGDVCTITLYRRGIMPHLAILDGKTKRSSHLDTEKMESYRIVEVRNPQGTISAELWSAIEKAMKSTERTLIMVQGEEDLAALPCISLAPDGAYVVYGIPNKGMCVVKVNENTRKKAKEALSMMRTEA